MPITEADWERYYAEQRLRRWGGSVLRRTNPERWVKLTLRLQAIESTPLPEEFISYPFSYDDVRRFRSSLGYDKIIYELRFGRTWEEAKREQFEKSCHTPTFFVMIEGFKLPQPRYECQVCGVAKHMHRPAEGADEAHGAKT